MQSQKEKKIGKHTHYINSYTNSYVRFPSYQSGGLHSLLGYTYEVE